MDQQWYGRVKSSPCTGRWNETNRASARQHEVFWVECKFQRCPGTSCHGRGAARGKKNPGRRRKSRRIKNTYGAGGTEEDEGKRMKGARSEKSKTGRSRRVRVTACGIRRVMWRQADNPLASSDKYEEYRAFSARIPHWFVLRGTKKKENRGRPAFPRTINPPRGHPRPSHLASGL